MKQIQDHTPGPWHVGESTIYTNHGFKVHGFPISGSGQAIAAVWNGSVGKEGLGFGNQEANASLIVVAPDMLAALMGLEIDLQHSIDCGTKEFSDEWLRDNLALIGAIVRKATQP